MGVFLDLTGIGWE